MGRRITVVALQEYAYQRVCTIEEVTEWVSEQNLPIEEGYINCDKLDPKLKALHNPDTALIQKKRERALGIANVISVIPFVRMVAVINSIAMGTAQAHSDIDLLILTQKKRMWIVRTLVPFYLRLRGLNKTKEHRTDRACLGMYATTDFGSYEALQLAPGKDIYLTYWAAVLTPLLDTGSHYRKWLVQQDWLFKALPNLKSRVTYKHPGRLFTRILRGFLEFFLIPFGGLLENICFRINLKRIYKFSENRRDDEDTSVIITGSMLKLHPYDKRPEMQRKFEKMLQTFTKALGSKHS
jgi:hypothetical protein